MKNKFILVLLTILAFSSCKKDDEIYNASTPESIQAIVLNGFWQCDQHQDYEGATIEEFEYFYVYDFINSNQVRLYYTKTDYVTQYYRFLYKNDKATLLIYDDLDDYNDDNYSYSNVLYVEVKDGKFTTLSSYHGNVYIFKKYNSMNAVKDKPTGL